MTKDDINKAFENRWRIKRPSTPMREDCEEEIKSLCRDFFEAGMLIGEGFTVFEDQCGTVICKHDPVIDTDDTGFSTWWNLYQKKRGKEKCMKKWAKLSLKDRQACIAATPAYVASTPDVTFRKDPYTYLNNSSWNDEIYFRNGTNKPSLDEQRKDKLASILTE